MKNYKSTKNLHCIINNVSPLAIKFVWIKIIWKKATKNYFFVNIVYHNHFELYDLLKGISNNKVAFLLFI